MRNFLFVIALLAIAAAGAAFFASLFKLHSQWAYHACTSAYGLCEHPWWIGTIGAGAAFVAFVLRATEI
jgi:hypothetical protein